MDIPTIMKYRKNIEHLIAAKRIFFEIVGRTHRLSIDVNTRQKMNTPKLGV